MRVDEVLRERGHRVTRSRQLVWSVLAASDRHLSVQEIAEGVWALDPGINLSSVYRTLALFSELDLVRESHLGDDAATWEPAHDDGVIHLVCQSCGEVQHHATRVVPRLRDELAQRADFDAEDIDVRVRGRCASCR